MRCTWEAQGFRSPEWTTCGGFILGPPRGTWAQYPRSKGMRQRDVRLFRRALRVLEQVLARASRLWSAGTYLLEEDARRDSQHREGLVAFVTDRSETTLRTVPSHVNGFRVLVVVGDSQAWATGPSLPTWEETKTKDAWRASQREAKRAASARRLARKLVSTRRAA